MQNTGVILGGGGSEPPTFWSGRTDLPLYKYTKSEILLGPHFSYQSYATVCKVQYCKIQCWESFNVLCGVRQCGVLSPHLFALYIKDTVEDLKNSGYCIYIGSLFLGSILYADDILLLSESCTGLQHIVHSVWKDLECFNPARSHCITFGGSSSNSTTLGAYVRQY